MNQPSDDRSAPLSDRDAIEVVASIGSVTASGLPLAEGLRVAAEESGQRRVGRALTAVAADVQRGRDIGEALAAGTSGLPSHLRGLVAAAIRCGQFDLILEQFLDRSAVQQDLWRALRRSLVYPTIVSTTSIVLFATVCRYVSEQIGDLAREFELTMNSGVARAIWMSQNALPAIIVSLVALMVVLTIVYCFSTAATRFRLLSSIPLGGRLWLWLGTAELARLLSVFVEHEIPQPESLRLAADAMHNADVAATARRIADTVEQGSSLSEAVQRNRLPATLVPLLRWGETAQKLDEALDAAAAEFERRAHFRLTLLNAILPPLLFVVIAGVLIALMTTVILPVLTLYRLLM